MFATFSFYTQARRLKYTEKSRVRPNVSGCFRSRTLAFVESESRPNNNNNEA